MQNTNLVSIIVPVYHVEKYLDDCVRSLTEQTYPDLEIILVDDGSDDMCPEMCDRWAEKDKRIKVIHKTNGGLSDARNAGLDAAKGEFAAFVDSDDLVHQNFVDALISVMKNNAECDIAICGFEKFTDGSALPQNKYDNSVSYIRPKDCFLQTDAFFDVAWNKLYRRSIVGDIRFPYRKLHEDIYTTYKYVFSARQIGVINAGLYYYRRREDSIIGKHENYPAIDIEAALWERTDFFKTKGDDIYGEALNAYITNAVRILKGFKLGKVEGNIEQINELKKHLKGLFSAVLRCSGLSVKKKIKLLIKLTFLTCK